MKREQRVGAERGPHPRERGPPGAQGFTEFANRIRALEPAVTLAHREEKVQALTRERASGNWYLSCLRWLSRRSARSRWYLEAGGRFIAQRSAVYKR